MISLRVATQGALFVSVVVLAACGGGDKPQEPARPRSPHPPRARRSARAAGNCWVAARRRGGAGMDADRGAPALRPRQPVGIHRRRGRDVPDLRLPGGGDGGLQRRRPKARGHHRHLPDGRRRGSLRHVRARSETPPPRSCRSAPRATGRATRSTSGPARATSSSRRRARTRRWPPAWRRWRRRWPGGSARPGHARAVFDRFPTASLVPHSFKVLPKDVLAQSYLSNGFEAEYREGAKPWKLLLVAFDADDAASAALDRYRGFLASSRAGAAINRRPRTGRLRRQGRLLRPGSGCPRGPAPGDSRRRPIRAPGDDAVVRPLQQ